MSKCIEVINEQAEKLVSAIDAMPHPRTPQMEYVRNLSVRILDAAKEMVTMPQTPLQLLPPEPSVQSDRQ